MSNILKTAQILSNGKDFSDMTAKELYKSISSSVMTKVIPRMEESEEKHNSGRRAYYFSAEYLVGRGIFNNLMNLGLTDEIERELQSKGTSLDKIESIGDDALGNGGLGRLAACFLDSAATLSIPLDGYGIRYKYGIFKQYFANGFQKETADDWTQNGDPWSVRKDEDTVQVKFGDMTVNAVPYDMPILGYRTKNLSNLRLWQSEALTPFDFNLFNDQKYEAAVKDKNRAEDISRVIYPNDSTQSGKLLRLRQEYFFTSASLQDILKKYKKTGNSLDDLGNFVTIQLNDTHPVLAIPELIRLLLNENLKFNQALNIAKQVFNYTNHTVMAEALEKWDIKLLKKICPEATKIIVKINSLCEKECNLKIIDGDIVNMAYLACYVCKFINGVAEIHTEIIKSTVLGEWYNIYPDKFYNMTNGITQRRWMLLCNREMSELITELMGSTAWVKKLYRLKDIDRFADDENVLRKFINIKKLKKQQLCKYIKEKENIDINPDWVFDVQIKRLHEYKRQLMNILAILELYFEIRDDEITDFKPTVFIFGAKAAPGYYRAKAIIKLVNEVAKLIDSDEKVREYIKVVFVSDYNVSYAEKIVAAADASQQISTAGTEASGTGNMKLMLNGAVTVGTYDGANIEIVEEAGEENNFIFGAKVEGIEKAKEDYNPQRLFNYDVKLQRVLNALVDGTLSDDDTGMFRDLYNSVVNEDRYFVMLDFNTYLETRKQLNECQKNEIEFAKKCWHNMCSSGKFSSDRTVMNYAKYIWKI